MNVRRHGAVVGLALLLAAAALGACEVNLNSEGIVSRETRTFAVTGTPDVQLETFDGSIEIHSWDRGEVEVEIERRAMDQQLVDEMKVSAEQQGSRIVVKVTGPARPGVEVIQVGFSFGPSARLRVALPRESHVSATSGDGSITVDDVRGRIGLTTGDGSVSGSRVSGDIVVRSGDGSIRMERIEGALDLETDDGSITLEARPTKLRAHTGDGSMRLEIEPGSVMSADWDLQTSDGSVTLSLPLAFNAVIDAETRDGTVRASHAGLRREAREGDEADRDERRRSLRATLGSGGYTLRIRSGDGSIRIED
jgi:DUF4097 and DUF4098 domain-containing protein YvlB